MCGRYTLSCGGEAGLREELPFDAFSETRLELRPRYNVAPGQDNPVVTFDGERAELRNARWGFERGTGGLLVNARSETASQSERFGNAYARGRCLVPADGFFEWRREGGLRQPYLFRPEGGGLLLMAGLLEDDRYVVLTCSATGAAADIHDRMPVQLRAEDAQRWLVAGALGEPIALTKTRVSPHVNRIDHDDPDCIKP
ncbi:MAG: SOS response-associated peptidase, partial [Polyangiales bacterium]